jgi:hypothetical protein
MSIAPGSRFVSAVLLVAALVTAPTGAYAEHHGDGGGHGHGHVHGGGFHDRGNDGGGDWGNGIYAMPGCVPPGYAPPPVYYAQAPCGYYAPPPGVYYSY